MLDCPVIQDNETGRVYTSATGERVYDQGKQQILRTVSGKVRGLNMRVAKVKKSLTSVYDLCAAGPRVTFDLGKDGTDRSSAENEDSGEKTYFNLRNRVWELEAKLIPKGETEDVLENMRTQQAGELCPFEGQVLWP